MHLHALELHIGDGTCTLIATVSRPANLIGGLLKGIKVSKKINYHRWEGKYSA